MPRESCQGSSNTLPRLPVTLRCHTDHVAEGVVEVARGVIADRVGDFSDSLVGEEQH